MKKIMAFLLSACMCLGLCSCSGSGTGETSETKTYGAYSKVWTAQEDGVTHETGDIAIDDGWGAVLETAHGNLCKATTETLHATAYTAAARLLVNEKSSLKTVAAVLRVVAADGTELGRQNVRLCDFEDKLTYKDFSFTFAVPSKTEATFEIYWPGNAYVRVSEFGIMSRTLEALPDQTVTGKAILGTDITEDAEIVYDENALYYFDLNAYMATMSDSEEMYDIANLVSTLQGLVNREGEHLFIRFEAANGFSQDTDAYWLNYLTQSGRLLADKTVVTVKSPMTLLKLFENKYAGFAAWDSLVPATVNAVATACGVEDLLPIRYSSVGNSLYAYVKYAEEFAEKPIKVDLGGKFTGNGKIYETEIQSTGSRKNDAYLWAKQKYLDTKKTNSHMMAYHVDAYSSDTIFAQYADLQNMFLSNRDYYIANKCFFFDLSPMAYEIPDDDPDQADYDVNENDGTIDYATFTAIMKAQNAYAAEIDAATPIDIGGFTPWHLKYTRYTNPSASGEGTYEWETAYQFSIYYAYINADAPSYTAMANASVYMHFEMQDSYSQTGSKTAKESLPTATEQGANYLLFYMGDYDASAWLNTAMIRFWNDENRGQIPLCWSYALNISKRAGHVIDMMYSTATENDYFVAGDNGVGYLNPEAFANAASSDMNGDLDKWAAYNKKVYEKFDIDYQGFLITRKSASKEIIECYSKFTKGTATNFGYTGDDVDGYGVVQSIDYSSVAELATQFATRKAGDSSTFTSIRFVLRSPSDVYAIYSQLTSDRYKDYNFKVVDPYTFYTLLEQQKNA